MKAVELRKSILYAAIQGKLIAQNVHDEPASELIKRIHRDKAQLIMEGKYKEKTQITLIEESDLPFDIPSNWAWCRFGDIVINRDSERIPVSREERSGREKIYDYYGASGTIDKIDSFLFDKPLLLIGEDGANLLARSTPIAFIASGLYWVNNHAHVLDCTVPDLLKYLCIYINSIDLAPYVTGTAQPKMNQEKMNAIIIALPPLKEQLRIVAKVDEMMALCDELEAAEKELDALENHLVEYLPKSILQAAVQGKLVPQNVHDEPVSELLKHIQQEKTHLIKEGKIKKEKPHASITEDEIPYDLPDGWALCRLNDLVAKMSSGSTPTGGRNVYSNSGYKFIRSQNVYNHGLVLDSVAYINEEIHLKMQGATVQGNDVLLNITGASIGRCCIVNSDFDIGHVNQHVMIVRLVDLSIIEYLHIYLISPYLQKEIMDQQVGVSREGLSASKLKGFSIPLPPLAEQQRIVSKVNELMALCDELKTVRDFTIKGISPNIVPFQHQKFDDKEELLFVARGDGKNLPQEALDDLAALFGED